MKSVKLKNLDCANCALKIEKKLNELEELNNVSLNFSTATLSFEKNVKYDVLEKIEKEIQKIEKDVVIVKDEEKIQKTFWELLNKKLLLITIVSITLTYISYNYVTNKEFQIALYLVAYLLVGWDVVYKAIKNLTQLSHIDSSK